VFPVRQIFANHHNFFNLQAFVCEGKIGHGHISAMIIGEGEPGFVVDFFSLETLVNHGLHGLVKNLFPQEV
jgi:hypothetical protein